MTVTVIETVMVAVTVAALIVMVKVTLTVTVAVLVTVTVTVTGTGTLTVVMLMTMVIQRSGCSIQGRDQPGPPPRGGKKSPTPPPFSTVGPQKVESVGFDPRLYCKELSETEKEKQQGFRRLYQSSCAYRAEDNERGDDGELREIHKDTYRDKLKEVADILADLTPSDVRVLVRAEEELGQCRGFERIFPTGSTAHYIQVKTTDTARAHIGQ